MKLKNYYKILNVSFNASQAEIKEAYRKLVKFWHPDVNPSPNSHEKIIEINEAYEILSDNLKKDLYNKIYEEYFIDTLIVKVKQNYQEDKNKSRYAEYQYDAKTSRDFEILQDWIREAKNKTDELIKRGLKTVDSSLETGFYAIGKIGDFFSTLFAIAILGAIGIYSIKYLIELIVGTTDFSVIGLIFSIIGISICVLVIIGWSKGNLKDD